MRNGVGDVNLSVKLCLYDRDLNYTKANIQT